MVVLLALRGAAPAQMRAQPQRTVDLPSLRSAMGLSQRDKPHHPLFVNDIIPVFLPPGALPLTPVFASRSPVFDEKPGFLTFQLVKSGSDLVNSGFQLGNSSSDLTISKTELVKSDSQLVKSNTELVIGSNELTISKLEIVKSGSEIVNSFNELVNCRLETINPKPAKPRTAARTGGGTFCRRWAIIAGFAVFRILTYYLLQLNMLHI